MIRGCAIGNEALDAKPRQSLRWSHEPNRDLRGMAADLSWMRERYEQLRSQGLDWAPPILESASEPRCIVDGREMIMLSANTTST